MTTEHLIICILAGLLVIERISHLLSGRAWARERRDLYNRLQAGSLSDYAQHKAIVEAPVAGDTRPQTPQGGYDSELSGMYGSFEEADLTPGQLASVQAMSERVLEG